MPLVRIYNGPAPTTASQLAVTTGTSIKTLLQVKPSATQIAKIVGWGISFDGSAAAAGIECECLETDVAATVTATVAADIVKLDADAIACGDLTTNIIQVGTTSTGYTSTGEGSITATRVFDAQFIQPTNQYIFRWELGNEPVIQVAKFARIRVKAGVAVNAICWMDIRT